MSIQLDVIIRTRGDSTRVESMKRAVHSAQAQNGVTARLLVVLNGERYDSHLKEFLEQHPAVELRFQREASIAKARILGRRLVTAPYFCFLDDDDFFIQDSLSRPLIWMQQHLSCDVLITNAYLPKQDGSMAEFIDIRSHIAVGDPLASLIDDNWLDPGASFFRTATVDETLVAAPQDHHEWGYIALRLCDGGKNIQFTDIPTKIKSDTPGSMSKELEHTVTELDFIRTMLRQPRLAKESKRKLRSKYRNAQHRLAWRYWQAGRPAHAWRYHLLSLSPPYTLKHILFSRKLLWRPPGSAVTQTEGRSRESAES